MTASKGQGIIGEIIIFGVSIMMALGMYFMFSAVDYETEHEVDFSVAHNIEHAVDQSGATVILQQEVEGENVANNYNGLTAYELTSIYVSTYEDPIINGEEIDRSEVKDDLEAYYEEKMDFRSEYGEAVNYRHIEIDPEHGNQLEFGELGDNVPWNDPPPTRNIQTSDGKADFRYWISREGTVGGVN